MAATGLGVITAEALVRLVAPQSVAVPWQDEMDGVPAPRPNVEGRHAIPNTFDVRVSFSSQRFRGPREFQLEAAPGVVRVAVLGDSFTFGYGANDEETYPAQLHRILENRLAERGVNRAVEVMNAGNGGTGTGEQALWYDVWVRRFKARVVVLTVTSNDVDNDLERAVFVSDGAGRVSPRPWEELRRADGSLRLVRNIVNGIPGYAAVAERSQLLGLARNAVSAAIARKRSSAPGAAGQRPGMERFGAEGLPLLMGEVRWLGRRVRESGAELAVVFAPSRESIYASTAPAAREIRRKSELVVQALRSICRAERIAFFDLTPEIRARAAEAGAPLYYAGLDTHPTPLGYGMMASAVAAFLADRELLKLDRVPAEDARGI